MSFFQVFSLLVFNALSVIAGGYLVYGALSGKLLPRKTYQAVQPKREINHEAASDLLMQAALVNPQFAQDDLSLAGSKRWQPSTADLKQAEKAMNAGKGFNFQTDFKKAN